MPQHFQPMKHNSHVMETTKDFGQSTITRVYLRFLFKEIKYIQVTVSYLYKYISVRTDDDQKYIGGMLNEQ